jgi:hypothetical protein
MGDERTVGSWRIQVVITGPLPRLSGVAAHRRRCSWLGCSITPGIAQNTCSSCRRPLAGLGSLCCPTSALRTSSGRVICVWTSRRWMAVSPSQVCGKAPVGPEALTCAMHSNSASRRSAKAKASATCRADNSRSPQRGLHPSRCTGASLTRTWICRNNCARWLRPGLLHPAPEGRDRDLFARST